MDCALSHWGYILGECAEHFSICLSDLQLVVNEFNGSTPSQIDGGCLYRPKSTLTFSCTHVPSNGWINGCWIGRTQSIGAISGKLPELQWLLLWHALGHYHSGFSVLRSAGTLAAGNEAGGSCKLYDAALFVVERSDATNLCKHITRMYKTPRCSTETGNKITS